MQYKTLLAPIIFFSLAACNTNTPNQQAAHYNAELGILYAQEGVYPNARIKAFKALALDPHSAQAHYAVAYYAQQTKQIALAQEHYLAALKLNPTSGRLNDSYGQFLCEQEDYQKALQFFEKAAQDVSYPKVSEVYEHAGNCALEIPNQAIADSFFLKAQQFDPRL